MNDHVGIEPRLVAISLLLAAATFVLDLFQPLGVAAGIPYVAVVLVALWSRERAFVYILASLASVLTIIGIFASTGEQDSWMVLENRGLALFAIWAVALAGARRVADLESADQTLRESEARLRATMEGGLDGVYFHKAVRNDQAEVVDFEFVDASERGIDMVPLSRDELIGTRLSEGYPDAFQNGLFEKLKTVLDAGVPLDEDMHALENVDAQWLHHQVVPYGDGVAFTVRDVTKAKEAEEALRESERRLQGAHRMAKLAHWNLDVATMRFTAYGDIYAKFSLDEGNSAFSFEEALAPVHPDDVARVREAFEHCFNEGMPYDETNRNVSATGEIRHIRIMAEAVRDETGAIARLEGTTQDVTAEKIVEQELRKARDRLAAAQKLAGMGVWELDSLTGKATWSEEMYRIFDLDPEENSPLTAETLYDYVHPEDRDSLREANEQFVHENSSKNTDYRIITKLGNVKSIVAYRSVQHDAENNVISLGGTLLDITALRAAEEELRRSQASLENAQRIARIGNWDWDLATGELRWSDEIYRIFGQTPQSFEANYDAFIDIVHPDDQAMVREVVDAALQDGTPYYTVHRIVLPDGQIKTVREEGEVRYAEDGTALFMSGVVQDVTDEVALEDQLRQAQKMETVGQLSAGVAHDFNNMLSVVMGNLELAQRRITGDPQVEGLIENALKASHRGAELTQSLLAFSRKQVLFPKPVDVNKSAQAILALAKRTVAKTVEITFEPLAGLWAAEVDPAHLESAVLNLVINASTAMPDGGEIKISTWNASQLDPAHRDEVSWPTADYVCLAITDTGHGMTPEVLERAIEPFFTTKGMAEGSGLGLSMVYGFVEQSGGLFDIVSEPGVGTKVTLSLPRSDKALRKEESLKPSERQEKNARTVLLVEDEPRVMETVAFQLSDLGFRVLVAADADEALRLLGQNIGIDLLFADVVLGAGKNGIDLALEARLKYPDLRVLCTSGYAGEELQARYEGAEDLQILGKPFTLDILSAKLDEVLGVDARSEGSSTLSSPHNPVRSP